MKKELRESQGVYAVHVIENEVNYVLIGSGLLGDRISGNPSKLRKNKHDCKELQKIYNRVNNVRMEILQVCESKEEARALENDYMEYYRRIEGVVVLNKYPAVVMEKEYKLVLDEEKVREIKLLLKDGKRNKDIAILYGVTDSVISKIKTGLRWGNVEI
jgi:ABC-type iron transport system FetAB ATPase subunit